MCIFFVDNIFHKLQDVLSLWDVAFGSEVTEGIMYNNFRIYSQMQPGSAISEDNLLALNRVEW